MQEDSDLWLHTLCVSTVQIGQNHRGRFYHKSSLPDFHANPTHLMVLLKICNMFCAVYPYSQLRTMLFSFHRTGKNQPSKRFLFVVGLSRLRLCLLLFFLFFILWLKFIWNHHEAALGLNLVGFFGSFYFGLSFSLFYFLSFAFSICEMSDTEPKLIAKCTDYGCAS